VGGGVFGVLAYGTSGHDDVTAHSLKLLIHQALPGGLPRDSLSLWLHKRGVTPEPCLAEWRSITDLWRGIFSENLRARSAPPAAVRACVSIVEAEAALRDLVPNNSFLVDDFRTAVAAGSETSDIRPDASALFKLRRTLEGGKYGVVPFPSRIPIFIRGVAAAKNAPRQFGILQLAKRGSLGPHLYAAMTPFMEEIRTLAGKLGKPIHLSVCIFLCLCLCLCFRGRLKPPAARLYLCTLWQASLGSPFI